MPNPGSFQGGRLAFLESQIPEYAASLVANSTAACVADVQRRFFKRFPLDLAETLEPSAEHLAAVDDGAADEEPPAPDESLQAEAYEEAVVAFTARSKLITSRRNVSDPGLHQTSPN